jgi:deoxyribodipyrimidine photolyase-like uncharacterized protein
VTRADIIRQAFESYHRGQISLAALVRTVVQWRPQR